MKKIYLNRKCVLLIVLIIIALYLFFYNQNSSVINDCNLEEIDHVPKDSIVIAGHAYGGVSGRNDFISNKLLTFLDSNKQYIKKVIFSGDVFKTPNKEKWNKLYHRYIDFFDIFIAVGNHDVGENGQYRNELNQSYFKDNIETESFHETDFQLILQDSFISKWNFDEIILKKIIEYAKTNRVFIVRHNVPFIDFLPYANSYAGLGYGLIKMEDSELLNAKNEIVIIAGDSGAFIQQPRLVCQKYKNLTVILNGIGDLEGDLVLVIDEGNIFYIEI